MNGKKRQDMTERELFEQMRIDYQRTRQLLLNSPVLHAAAGIPSEDFRGISDLIDDSQERPEHYDTNLPFWFSEPSYARQILEYQERYPYVFEDCQGRGGVIIPGYPRWQLSWLGRALFKEYPYQVDLALNAGKLQTVIDCTFHAQTNGIPIYILGHLTCDVLKHNTFNAFEYFVFGIEENWSTDFDFEGVDTPVGGKIQLDTGEEVTEGKAYPVSFAIEVASTLYEPYGELEIENAFLGCDGSISSR
ncbi:hypothetical protein J5I95_10565 [Candidatus Poribacteria bacterium]|nr:hypothetical protein [Candidatus Poribacteria bacterium]